MHHRKSIPLISFFAAFAFQTSSSFAAPPKMTPELISKGKAAYTTNCLPCHGAAGDGKGPAAAALNPKPRDFSSKDLKPGKHYKKGGKPEQLFQTITKGLPGTAMAPFGHLPEEDRWGIVYYIRSEFQKLK